MFVEGRRLTTTIAIKRLAAIFLLVAFFLPLSQCTVAERPETKTTELEVIVTYAYSAHKWPSVNALATYAAFLWPLTLSIASLVWPRLNQKWTIGIIELLLCAGSAFILFGLTYFGALRYGAYVAGGSIGLYFITTSVELAARVRKKWGKQTYPAVPPDPRERRFAPPLGRVNGDVRFQICRASGSLF